MRALGPTSRRADEGRGGPDESVLADERPMSRRGAPSARMRVSYNYERALGTSIFQVLQYLTNYNQTDVFKHRSLETHHKIRQATVHLQYKQRPIQIGCLQRGSH